MSSDPDDISNNPYNEGGARSTPTPAPTGSQNVWFCHSCQRDIPGNQLLRNPDPSCPFCHGDFVEETGESIDDPHEFDRPVFPFPPFLARPQGPSQADDGHQHPEHGEAGQQPQFMFVPAPGQAAGPFGMLFQALAQGMQQGQPGQQGQHAPHRPASAPPLSPEEAARQAAQRRAGLIPESSGAPGGHSQSPEAAHRSGASAQQDSRPSSATGGIYRSGPATFVWTSGGARPPPASYPSSPQQAHRHLGEGTPQPAAQQQQQQQQGQQAGGSPGPVRNLASFLQEAFSGGQHHTSSTAQGQQQTAPGGQSGQQAAAQSGNAQPAGGEQQGHQSDPLMHMLGGLANMFGFPVQGMTGQATQQGQQQEGRQQTAQGQTGAQLQGAQPGHEHGPEGHHHPHQHGTHQFTFGTPSQGARIVFTIGGPPGDTAANPMPAFLPFMFGLGHESHVPGQMGDYVFSQGALDNIITELMNQAQGRYGPQPATEEIINNLPTFKMTKDLLSNDSITECAVCKDDFQEEEDIMKLPCNHIFHTDCIKPWLERSGTCPICRHQLVPQPEPPRAPGVEGASTEMQTDTPDQSSQGGPRRPPVRQQSNPASPSLPRSPPIAEGSSMPGSFPFGNLFTTIGNMMSGTSSSNNSNTAGNTSSATARSSGDTNNLASMEEQNQNNQQQGQTQTQQSGRQQEQQGQPDLDLDLD